MLRVGILAVLVVVAETSGTPLCSVEATAEPASITWQGITIGEPTLRLRSTFGDPLYVGGIIAVIKGEMKNLVKPLHPGYLWPGVPREQSSVVYWFWFPGSTSTFFMVLSEQGHVVGFEAALAGEDPSRSLTSLPADPSGVHLGDTMASVEAKHPAFNPEEAEGYDCFGGWCPSGPFYVLSGDGPLRKSHIVYEFDAGRVSDFQWYLSAPSQPALPEPTAPSGESPAEAILDLQHNDADGLEWERLFVTSADCDNDGVRWTVRRQSTINYQGRAFGMITAVCPTTDTERMFYFDISSFHPMPAS